MADLTTIARQKIAELTRNGASYEDAALEVAKSVYAAGSVFPGMQSPAAIAVSVAETDLIPFDEPTPATRNPDRAFGSGFKNKKSVIEHLFEAVGAHRQQDLDGLPGKDALVQKTSPLDAIAAAAREHKNSQQMEAAVKEMEQLEMSLFQVAPWDDDLRAIPNDWGRSAVFTTRNKTVPRAACEDKHIFHYNKDVEITYTGVELRSDDDELVWVQVVEYAKHTPLGKNVEFSLYELCNDLGWHINKFYYGRALKCLQRLKATCFSIKSPRYAKIKNLSLLDDFDIKKVGRKAICTATLDPRSVILFTNDHYSKVLWSKYRKLSPTARRMFDYFSTHQKPYPLKLETFRLICGSESVREKKWAEQSRDACKELVDVGLVTAANVENGFIICQRAA